MNQKYVFDKRFNGVQNDYNTLNKYDTIILKYNKHRKNNKHCKTLKTIS